MLSTSTTENALAILLKRNRSLYAQAPFLVSASGTESWAAFDSACRALAQRLSRLPQQRLGCQAVDSPALVRLLFAAAFSNKTLVLFNPDHPTEQVDQLRRELDIELLLPDPGQQAVVATQSVPVTTQAAPPRLERAEDQVAGHGELLIMTSGTTGKSKCARYLWRDLVAQVPAKHAGKNERWLLAYRLSHFAGIQMLLHALVNSTTLVIPSSSQVSASLAAVREHEVTHISSTPTFWRFALAALSQPLTSIAHITLGSEAVSSELLTKLKTHFPRARIVHIYATTELGSCVSVSDGKAGLPLSILDRDSTAGVQFRIVDGELQVKSRHGMLGYQAESAHQGPSAPPGTASRGTVGTQGWLEDGWRTTGDLVIVREDRIHFQGRRSEVINVGGVKVHPQEVEAVLDTIAGIRLARAYGRDNPVTGQIVAVDIVLEPGHEQQLVEDNIYAACLSLSRHSRPRSVNFVDSLATNNYKLERQ